MRRWVKIVCALVPLLVLSDAVLWLVAVDRMRDSWHGLLAQAEAQGWVIAVQEPEAEGWPWAARLRVDGLEMSHPDQPLPGGVAFGAEKLLVELPFLTPTQLLVIPQGRMHGRIGPMSDVALTASRLSLRAGLTDNSVHLAAEAFSAHTAPDPVSVAHLSVDLQRSVDGITLGGSLDGLDLSLLASRMRLSGLVSHLTFAATFDRGIFTLRDLVLDWGKLGLTGNATLRADAEGQPDGDGRLAITGAGESLDEFVAAGRLTPQNAATAKLIIGVLQHRGPDGRMVLDLPVGVHQRRIFAAQFPVAVLPPMPPMTGMRP